MENGNKQEQERCGIVPYWVLDTPGLSSTDKLVFTVLCMFRDKHGICFPSIMNISRLSSMSKSTVIRALGRLENFGVISRRHRYKERGKTSNEYFVPREKPVFSKCHDDTIQAISKCHYDTRRESERDLNNGVPLADFERVIKQMMEAD